MGFFPNGDEVLKGIKRGAAKFGSGGALDAVKGMAKRLNGFSPAESEPYGLGMGGGEGEQSAPTQAEEDMSLQNATTPGIWDGSPKEARERILAGYGANASWAKLDWVDLPQEVRSAISKYLSRTKQNDDGAASASGGNVTSSSLGYESAQKTTTEKRESINSPETKDQLKELIKRKKAWLEENASRRGEAGYTGYEEDIKRAEKALSTLENSSDMASKCQACGHESSSEWTGKCEGCGVKNASDASGRSPAMRENAGRLVEEYRGYRLVQDGKGFAAYEKNGPTLVAASSISLDKLKEEVDSYLDSRKNADEAKCGDCGATKGLVEFPASRGKEPKYLCRQCWDDNGTGERENDGPRDCTKCGHDVQTDHTATSLGMKCKLCDCRDGTTYKNDGAEQTQDENYPHDAGAGGREAVRVEEEMTNTISIEEWEELGRNFAKQSSLPSDKADQLLQIIHSSDDAGLKELASRNIKFVSPLAKNEMARRGLKNSEDTDKCLGYKDGISGEKCGKPYPKGRVAARCDECLKKWDDSQKKEKRNAGHLGADAWLQASLEERIQWLESAGCDINLATFSSWEDLSEDVHVALQDRYDMPESINNDKVGDAWTGMGGDELRAILRELGVKDAADVSYKYWKIEIQ